MLATEIADVLETTAAIGGEDATVNRMTAACIRDLLDVTQAAEQYCRADPQIRGECYREMCERINTVISKGWFSQDAGN